MSVVRLFRGIRAVSILSVALTLWLPKVFASDDEDMVKIIIEAASAESSQIVVRHLPNISIGSGLRAKDDIRNQWIYKIHMRCIHSCAGKDKDDSHIIKFLLSGVRQVNKCPIPTNSLITFESADGDTVLDVYVHQSGHCFEIGDVSYYSSVAFEPLGNARLL